MRTVEAGSERERVFSTGGFRANHVPPSSDLDASVLSKLSDREDGVALLVEALSHDHAMGRFHEFIRLFERAFARSGKTLTSPLNEFLSSRFGYTTAELSRWFEELRDPATHADARTEFLLEADVRPVIDRMEQAAFDVLLNKALWRDPSTDRRDVWAPTAGSTNPRGGAFIVQGTTPVTYGAILDEYGAFPMDLSGVIAQRPGSWWPQTDTPESVTEEFARSMKVAFKSLMPTVTGPAAVCRWDAGRSARPRLPWSLLDR